MSQFHITTQDDLPGPDGDEPYVLFVNQTEYGNARFLRTNVLSARPDLKKYTALRFRQEVKRHADAAGPGEDVVLVVTAGTKRLDNRKFKDRFGVKPRMLDAEAVVEATSHPVGGVCPFGLPSPLKVYGDLSLKAFDEVVPAGGATNAAVKIAPERMIALVDGEWADLCQ